MSLEENGSYQRVLGVAPKYGCFVEKEFKKNGETVTEYCFRLRRKDDKKILVEAKYPGGKGLDFACQEFNDTIAVWRETNKAKSLREKTKKENEEASAGKKDPGAA